MEQHMDLRRHLSLDLGWTLVGTLVEPWFDLCLDLGWTLGWTLVRTFVCTLVQIFRYENILTVDLLFSSLSLRSHDDGG